MQDFAETTYSMYSLSQFGHFRKKIRAVGGHLLCESVVPLEAGKDINSNGHEHIEEDLSAIGDQKIVNFARFKSSKRRNHLICSFEIRMNSSVFPLEIAHDEAELSTTLVK